MVLYYFIQESIWEISHFQVARLTDGYDEISLTDKFTVISNNENRIYQASDLGLDSVSPEDLHGGNTIEEAAEIFTTILSGKGTTKQNQVVLANAAFSIKTFKPESTFESCLMKPNNH